jgi:hypothetical protein
VKQEAWTPVVRASPLRGFGTALVAMEVLLAGHGAGASEKGQADQNSQEKSLHAQEAPTFSNPSLHAGFCPWQEPKSLIVLTSRHTETADAALLARE